MFIYVLDLIGVVVFAITGALAGGRKRMDVFGIVVVGVVTAVGHHTALSNAVERTGLDKIRSSGEQARCERICRAAL